MAVGGLSIASAATAFFGRPGPRFIWDPEASCCVGTSCDCPTSRSFGLPRAGFTAISVDFNVGIRTFFFSKRHQSSVYSSIVFEKWGM